MAWRFCLPHQRALWYTHVNSGSLPCAPRCGDPLYHMLESPTFPSTVLSTLLMIFMSIIEHGWNICSHAFGLGGLCMTLAGP